MCTVHCLRFNQTPPILPIANTLESMFFLKKFTTDLNFGLEDREQMNLI